MSSSAPQDMTISVYRYVLKVLKASPGTVTDIFLVKAPACYDKKGLAKALHVVKKLVGTDFEFVVNYNFECQLVVRAASFSARVKLEQALPHFFKFDDVTVKIFKLRQIKLLPETEDFFVNAQLLLFHCSAGDLTVERQEELGYQLGYSNMLMDMETVQNPSFSDTTTSILGIEGMTIDGLVRADVKNLFSPNDSPHVYNVVPSWMKGYKLAIEKTCTLYMKFEDPANAEYMCMMHFYLGSHMVKFYPILSARRLRETEDITKTLPIFSSLDNITYAEHQFAQE